MTLKDLLIYLYFDSKITLRAFVNIKESTEFEDFVFDNRLDLEALLEVHNIDPKDLEVSNIVAMDKDDFCITIPSGWDFKKWSKKE